MTRRYTSILTVTLSLIVILFQLACPFQVSASKVDVNSTLPIVNTIQSFDIVDQYIGTPYRVDGAQDIHGQFTLFEDHNTIFQTPGLNCSGLVVALSRCLLNKPIELGSITADRLDDSGPDSVLGEDWDFGFDLIFNISENMAPRVIMPDGKAARIQGQTGQSLRGFDLNDLESWEGVLPQIKPGRLYLASFSKPTSLVPAEVLHHHVAVIITDSQGKVWLIHATKKDGANKINLSDVNDMDRFQAGFKSQQPGERKILILEVAP